VLGGANAGGWGGPAPGGALDSFSADTAGVVGGELARRLKTLCDPPF
jgi:hypothetical protein